MFKKLLVFIPIALSVGAMQVQAGMLPVPGPTPMQVRQVYGDVLAEREMLLTNRHADAWVNGVFADNMRLTLAYLSGDVKTAQDINWDAVRRPKTQEFTLKPGEVFAYHDTVMAQFAAQTTVTTRAHFSAQDGFRSSGFLYGDGVCHLASLFNQAGRAAGLNVVAPVNHDFATIPDLAREYGTAIYYDPFNHSVSEQQNLYIENTLDKPVTFVIRTETDKIVVTIVK